jgi:hypothetical protein
MAVLRFLAGASALIGAFCCASPVPAVLVLGETFNSDSAFTKADDDGPQSLFAIGDEYWGINDPSGGTDDYDGDSEPSGVPNYSGFGGNFFNGGNELEDEGAELPLQLDWSNLPIAGLTNLMFSGLFAAHGDFDNGLSGDYVRVLYRIDDNPSGFTDLLWFSAENDKSDAALAVDADFNGTGEGTVLTKTAAIFSEAIQGTGNTLDLRILMSTDNEEKEFAFDALTITGVPEPGAYLFGCLVFGITVLVSFGRRLVWKKVIAGARATG